jgi:uncharacterized protein (TIGR02246 family)
MLGATARLFTLSIAVLAAIGQATVAQPTEASQADAQAIKATHEAFLRAWNKHDPSVLAALFTANSLLISPTGISDGRKEVESYFKDLLDRFPSTKDLVEPVDYLRMLSGNMAVATGSWAIPSLNSKGYWTEVYERQTQEWKIYLYTFNFAPPEVSPASR